MSELPSLAPKSLRTLSPVPTRDNAIERTARQRENVFYIPLSGHTSDEVVRELQEGSYQGYNDTPIQSIETVLRHGLNPKYRLYLGDVEVFFSDPFEFGERMAFIGYIKDLAWANQNGTVSLRGYYLSNTQCTWRYYPGYNKKKDCYDKGFGEDSLNVPYGLQKAMSEICASVERDRAAGRIPSTAYKLPTTTGRISPADCPVLTTGNFISLWPQYTSKTSPEYLNSTYAQQTNRDPFILDNGNPDHLTPPEDIKVDNQLEPNFHKLTTKWHINSPLYGQVAVSVFPSRDGWLKYMFCKSEEGKVWVGGVEITGSLTNRINAVGLRTNWVLGGSLTTPAYEHYIPKQDLDQSGGYGTFTNCPKWHVSMFELYQSQIPMVKGFIESGR